MSYFEGGSDDEYNKAIGSDDETSSDNDSVISEDKQELEEDVNNDLEDDVENIEEENEDDEDDESFDGDNPEGENEEDEKNEDIDDEDEQIGGDNDLEKKGKRKKKIPTKQVYKKTLDDEDTDEDDDDDGELYLQKFDQSIHNNYLLKYHPESTLQNYDEILSMTNVVRDKNGIIVDDLHKTIPYLTKYERARILGQRAKQINSGATPFVKVPENVIDGYLIAELELKQKRIPFIIRRPLPNGGSEYWSIRDLEDISF
jgi:DNA-directed RNA polymerase I, II, and III subunit RPABC2